MADYTSGEYGHPYPRVDQYGNPVPPVDQYGNPIPREPDQLMSFSSGGDIVTVLPYRSTGVDVVGRAVGDGFNGAAYPHEGMVSGVVSRDGVAYTEIPVSGGVAPDETTTFAYEGMVGSGISGAADADQIQPTREDHATLGETLRRSGSSSSSSSSEDEGCGKGKKGIKEKIKEKLLGSHKQQHEAAGTWTHAAGPHEKKGIMEKIKEKLPGHH